MDKTWLLLFDKIRSSPLSGLRKEIIHMLSYLLQGIWAAKRCVLIGVIVFGVYQGILMILKKRTIHQYKDLSKVLLLAEFLLSVYICTILDITGALDTRIHFGFSPSNLPGFISIPFAGASIKMVTLNFMLFVPYGFLAYFCFRTMKLNWRKAILIGFFTSLIIECMQAFTGRMTEIDDLLINTAGFAAGYLVAEGIAKLKDAKTRKKGLVQCLVTTLVSVALLFLLSFIANGDTIQAEECSYYNGIASPEGSLDTELTALSELNVCSGSKQYDALHNSDSAYETWYEYIGTDINNKAGFYVIEDYSGKYIPTIDKEKTYFEIKYSEPLMFRFYNNREWEMSAVQYILYCADDGELWYGSDENAIIYHAYYDSDEYPYEKDTLLMNELNEWLAMR